MNSNMNHATMAHVVASFARQGFWPSPKVDDHQASDHVVEIVVDHDGHNALVVVSCDMAAASATVHYGNQSIDVTSIFDNGSGVCFRSEGHEASSEFLSVDHQHGTITLNGRVIETPAGLARQATNREFAALAAQLPVEEEVLSVG